MSKPKSQLLHPLHRRTSAQLQPSARPLRPCGIICTDENIEKNKLIIVMLLVVALGFSGYCLCKKIKKNGKLKKQANEQDVDDFAREEMGISVDTSEE